VPAVLYWINKAFPMKLPAASSGASQGDIILFAANDGELYPERLKKAAGFLYPAASGINFSFLSGN